MISPEVLKYAEILRKYAACEMEPIQADCILLLGTIDLVAAERGAELYHQWFSQRIICAWWTPSRKYLGETHGVSEAELLQRRLIDLGVPAHMILVEPNSRNTWENIEFSYKLMIENSIPMSTVILVQKPYMLRRTYTTFLKRRPDKSTNLITTSVSDSFLEYAQKYETPEIIINKMVWDIQRLKVYSEKYDRDNDPMLPVHEKERLKLSWWYAVHVDIPEDIWDAYEHLTELWYDKQLIQNTA